MATVHLILIVLALICFLLAALDLKRPSATNLIGAGLFLWLFSTLVLGR